MSHYYIYKISQGPGQVFKTLDKIDRFDNYKEAKQRIKSLRLEANEGNASYKIIFAENELAAEEMLQEKREAPVVEEWEK